MLTRQSELDNKRTIYKKVPS